MNLKKPLFIFLLFYSYITYSTGEYYYSGGRSAGMANSSIMLSDVWSIYHNQAGLAKVKEINLGVCYSSTFTQLDLSLKSLGVAIPVPFGTFGIALSHFGFSSYSETRAGLGFAKTFGEKFTMGIQMNYFNLNIPEYYGNRGTAFAEIGVLSEPVKNLYIGGHVYNPTRAKIANYNDERMPTVMRFGIGYNFSGKALLTAETEKDLMYPVVFKAGVDYHILKNLYFRAGISTKTESQYAFGVGFESKGFKTDFAFGYHAVLGFTPHVSMCYAFIKKEQEVLIN